MAIDYLKAVLIAILESGSGGKHSSGVNVANIKKAEAIISVCTLPESNDVIKR